MTDPGESQDGEVQASIPTEVVPTETRATEALVDPQPRETVGDPACSYYLTRDSLPTAWIESLGDIRLRDLSRIGKELWVLFLTILALFGITLASANKWFSQRFVARAELQPLQKRLDLDELILKRLIQILWKEAEVELEDLCSTWFFAQCGIRGGIPDLNTSRCIFVKSDPSRNSVWSYRQFSKECSGALPEDGGDGGRGWTKGRGP
ncbi:MAG: hypothetical protein GY854_22385 [Deltaproteobacteria bacterium]|nr:hypothetical protein [Deltaproteobacteria bacterium]